MDDTVLDTTEEAARAQREVWRRMGPSGRLALALEMSDDVRAIAVAGERRRNPAATAEEAEEAVRRRLWGDDLHAAVRGRRGSG